MDVTFFHGPDRTPLHVDTDGAVAASGGLPFHGVASRGLLSWLEQQPRGAELWERLAHRLHDGTDADVPALSSLRGAANSHRVLSLAQSADVARRYAEARWAPDLSIKACELWNIKEGHTSSVWMVALAADTKEGGSRFVLNVARDAQGAEELRATSKRMLDLSVRVPDLPVAGVLDIAIVVLDDDKWDEPLPVTVTRNELVPDALEVHRLDGREGRSCSYALIERFITRDDAPARIRAVRGRYASAQEQQTIDEAVERLLAVAEPADSIMIDINHGDVVWDGCRAVVVAIGVADASGG